MPNKNISNQDIYDKLLEISDLKEDVKKNTDFRRGHIWVYKFVGGTSLVVGGIWAAVKGLFHGG